MDSSRAFDTQAVDAALSDIGHLTALFPDTLQMQQVQAGADKAQVSVILSGRGIEQSIFMQSRLPGHESQLPAVACN